MRPPDWLKNIFSPPPVSEEVRHAVSAAMDTSDPAAATNRGVVTGDRLVDRARRGGALHFGSQITDGVLHYGDGLPGKTANIATNGGIAAGGTVQRIDRSGGIAHFGGQHVAATLVPSSPDTHAIPSTHGSQIADGFGSAVARGPVVSANRSGGIVHFGAQSAVIIKKPGDTLGHARHLDTHMPVAHVAPPVKPTHRPAHAADLHHADSHVSPHDGHGAPAQHHAHVSHYVDGDHSTHVQSHATEHVTPFFPGAKADNGGVIAGGNVVQQDRTGWLNLHVGGSRVKIK